MREAHGFCGLEIEAQLKKAGSLQPADRPGFSPCGSGDVGGGGAGIDRPHWKP